MRQDHVRIPTILGLLVLISGIAAGVWLVNSKQLTGLTANPANQPTYVTLTDISDTGFTISWVTNFATKGIVMFGASPDSLNQTAIDDRDQEHLQSSSYKTHYVILGKTIPLTPATNYYFVIQSGSATYDNHGKPYQIKTAPSTTEQIPEADSISGKVIHTDGSPAAGAIVYVVLPNVSAQSTLTTTSGNWIIPLSLARSADLSQFAIYDHQGSLSQIFVQGDSGDTSSVDVTLADARPTATITLGQSYDWRTNQKPSPLPTSTASATLGAKTGFPLQPLGSSLPENKNVTIYYPKPNETISIARPSFIGNGPKGATLNFIIESSQKITGSVTVISDGTWEWNIPTDISSGQHTLTILYKDFQGISQKISRNFSIVLGQVRGVADIAFAASPSGSLAPTPTPTPTSTPTVSATPTPSLSPSPTPSPTPTTSPNLTSPSPTSLPVSGNTLPTIALTILGLTILLAGAIPLLSKIHVER